MKSAAPSASDLTALAPRPLSRLSYQIMGLNLMAILILIAGVFYLDQYKKDLTAAETEILATEAKLYASVLSDNAINDTAINIPTAQKLFDTFSQQKTQRLRMFTPDGKLLVDTKTSDRLPQSPSRPALPGLLGGIVDVLFSSVTDLFSINFELPLYPVTNDEDMSSFPDAKQALTSDFSLSAWQSRDGGLILSTAVPVVKNNQIRAIVLVTRADAKIQHTFGVMRVGIMQFFFGSLLITLSFSLYLSAAIGHPLRKLATAAEAVREGRAGIEVIPDLSYRKDEIGELSWALREMAGALQERIDGIERFAADVSHELKNPLTSMRSAVETLGKVKRDEDRQKLMSIIMHDLLRMDRLITDISRASRLDVELLRDVLSPVDLRSIIMPLVDAYRKPLDRGEHADDMPHNIVCEGLNEPVMIRGQSVRLSQVFQNLIENALSFSPPGKAVRVIVKEGPEFINIMVEDEGPGIPPNRLEKIFERFYTERPNASFGTHSGLGLSIVKQIIFAHEGTVSAQNRIDANGNIVGARFMVRLKPA